MYFNYNRENILTYVSKYNNYAKVTNDEKIEQELIKWFKKNKFLDKRTFWKLCLWKSKRPKKHYESKINTEQRIKRITSFALKINDEYLRINCLLLLKGVSWSVASVILHFAYPNNYIIMDFRAIWSLGWKQPKSYNFVFWQKYINKANRIAKEKKVTLRQLDKALWYYSKENQK